MDERKKHLNLSVVIPAHNEGGCVAQTVLSLTQALDKAQIIHEIIVVNDNSSDNTVEVLSELQKNISGLVVVHNCPPHGYGFAVRAGIEKAQGDAVAIFMADQSDNPQDLVHFYRVMHYERVDCVFGNRWHADSKVLDYPWSKKLINRMANLFIRLIFGLDYGDITNAFKLYSRKTLLSLRPYLSHHFNFTVELPLKAIVRGYSYRVVSNDWYNRKKGMSKLKIQEMGSRYLFIVLYCLIEKWLSKKDYHSEMMYGLSDRNANSISNRP